MNGPKATMAEMVTGAYELNGSFETWFAGVVSRFRGHLDAGFGTGAVVSATESSEILHIHLDGAHPIHRLVSHLSQPLVRTVAPRDFTATSFSEMVGGPACARFLARFQRVVPTADAHALWGVDGAGISLSIFSPRRDLRPPSAIEHRLARHVLPHVAAALRLRRSLTGLGLETPSAEAVFEPNGRCLNAQGMGEPASARDVLRSAVLRMEGDRARASDEPESAREALLDGRWSLVDRFESDGRRFIVAYRNPPGVLDPRRLSRRERDVAARVAQGMSQATVASELGISASTVASVASAMVTKLGLGSTRELPLFWRDTAGCPIALGREEAIAIEGVARPAAVQKLTPAEREVLKDVIRGRSNREIAARRRASVRTVANQIGALLKKLGAASRLELAAQSLGEE
jgi:DNA-binding NarL/FixJ family response regulator